MKLKLKIWRQENATAKGSIKTYSLDGVSPDMSFLEMMDVLNEQLMEQGVDPVAFDHDCREGICGSCSMFINGEAHGPDRLITTCQLHMRKFKDGDTIHIEPFRAKSFPVIKDLVVDRTAFDRIQHAGGFVSVNTSGNTQDANTLPIEKEAALEISRRSRGTPRIANLLLRRVRDFADVKGDGHVRLDITKHALDALNVDENGLDEMDARILRAILTKFKGGPVGLSTIATAIGEDSGTIEEVYEPYLIQQGFLQRTPRGRECTAKAWEYFGEGQSGPMKGLFG